MKLTGTSLLSVWLALLPFRFTFKRKNIELKIYMPLIRMEMRMTLLRL